MLTKIHFFFPLLLATLLGALLPLPAAEFSIEREADGITIKLDGELFTKYVTGDTASNKPYFYPVIGPTGKEMTRAYPMKDVEGEAQDHPHHRSFYFGHQFVNDFDTWHEELTLVARAKGDAEKLAEMRKTLGATVHREVIEASASGDRAVLKVSSDYVDSSGGRMAEDVRTFVFHLGADGSRIVDTDIVFTGVADEVRFSDAKDAGLSIRVAHSMSVDAKEGGRIANSAGDEDKDAWGKRADWCDFSGPVGGGPVGGDPVGGDPVGGDPVGGDPVGGETLGGDPVGGDPVGGETLGIAILNHPGSFRYPTPWHARTYGLFTANPFGLKSVAGEEEDGTAILKKGESFTLRHRILFHAGDEKAAKIAEAWKAYAAEP